MVMEYPTSQNKLNEKMLYFTTWKCLIIGLPICAISVHLLLCIASIFISLTLYFIVIVLQSTVIWRYSSDTLKYSRYIRVSIWPATGRKSTSDTQMHVIYTDIVSINLPDGFMFRQSAQKITTPT